MEPEPDNLSEQDLRAKLNLETGRLTWSELQRHFARGVVVVVEPELDLVEAAARIARDDRARVQAWAEAGRIHRASDEDARRWQAQGAGFWAVVVAPWVLVQELAGEVDGGES